MKTNKFAEGAVEEEDFTSGQTCIPFCINISCPVSDAAVVMNGFYSLVAFAVTFTQHSKCLLLID